MVMMIMLVVALVVMRSLSLVISLVEYRFLVLLKKLQDCVPRIYSTSVSPNVCNVTLHSENMVNIYEY